jgi:hypothetical protein
MYSVTDNLISKVSMLWTDTVFGLVVTKECIHLSSPLTTLQTEGQFLRIFFVTVMCLTKCYTLNKERVRST